MQSDERTAPGALSVGLDLAVVAAIEDRYRLEQEIGAGGMATVYRARDLKHDRDVAIKMLLPELSALLGAERFLSEIKTTAALQHPHILPLFDSGVAAGRLFYVMPLVKGETLRSRLTREHQLPVADAVRIATEIAGALDYAHRHGVVHRDIKPENILLHEGNAMVADFGIALALQHAGGDRMTQTGLSLGTPRYMSPEQAMGEKSITARSDVYALGVVTYEMLTGEPPFTGTTAQMVVARVLSEEPRTIAAQRKHVPPSVESAVLTALEKLPADRFGSAGEFARALGDSANAMSNSGQRRAVKPRVATPMNVLALLAAGACGAALVWGWTRAERTPPAVVQITVPLPRGVTPASDQEAGANVAISPDGGVVAFAADAVDGRRWIYVRTLDELHLRILDGTEGARQPFFSTDGRQIGFWSDGKIRKIAVEGGASQPVASVGSYAGASWTKNDVIVFATRAGIYSVPGDGGEPTLIVAPDTTLGEAALIYPVALSDGDHVLYSRRAGSGLDNNRLAVVSLSSRRSHTLAVIGTYPLGTFGKSLFYASRDNTLQSIPWDARAADVTGTATTVLTEVQLGAGGAAKAALSASGSLVYRGGSRESRLMLTDGRTARPALPDARVYLYPRLSPTGRHIAYTIDAGVRSDVWIYDQQSGTSTRLSTAAGLTNDRAEWTPNGIHVLYRTDGKGGASIVWRPIDLSGPQVPIVATPGRMYYEGVITPDGRNLVYQDGTDGSRIMTRVLNGDPSSIGSAEVVSDGSQARVSPNGEWVAFVTSETGSAEVNVQPFPGPGARVKVSQKGGTEPVWSRDGGRLFYRGNKKFMAATVVSGSTFAIRTRATLFDDTFLTGVAPHANYDVALDGKHFLVVEATESQQMIVIQNWGADLAAKRRAARR